MKILIVCIPTPGNRFVTDLKEGLEEHAHVTWNCDEFWNMENHYDIVHIHWPEYLSYELESFLSSKRPIPKKLLEKLKRCLSYWSSRSILIYTRHNHLPHSRKDRDFRKLYQLVFSYCHTVVHFANYSIQQFKEFYPELTQIKHVVIPHHNYASLPDLSTKEGARAYLNINQKADVMLVFGGIREREKPLIKKAFEAIQNKNKVLLAPGWKIQRRKISYIRLREWVWKLEKWWASKNKKFRVDLGFIQEEKAHYYLNAADSLFIPRTTELNSGNITLGCTFGLVVVGKDTADIGEILQETGNPTFKVGDDKSLELAINKAMQLKSNKHGEKNKEIALSDWTVESIAGSYFTEMKNLIAL